MNIELLSNAVHEFQRANSELLACALVYGVGQPALYAELTQWFGPEVADSRLALIFDARRETGNDQYGPFLVRLSQGTEHPSRSLERLAECCLGDFRSVSFLFSSLEFEPLADALRERLDVVFEDHSEWHLKYFDTRSLDVLDRALSDEQRTPFFAMTREWWFLDRNLQLRRVEGSSGEVDRYRAPLSLSEQQAKAFIDASLPDSVLYTLRLTDSDLLDEFDSATRYRICERSLVDASENEKNSTLLLANRVRASLTRAMGDSSDDSA
ncbi:DUF4123 domain-containing protein [Paraburkholderia sp. EG287B]|uniref:DUF4123 domain-containing protein n=1 Tax=Paraburkholderia sp. EG287B TaxID=3237010 RepID=UPI0034D19541